MVSSLPSILGILLSFFINAKKTDSTFYVTLLAHKCICFFQYSTDAVVRRKLLRRRHVRKLQKVRAATTIIEAPAASTNNNNNHATEVTTDRPSANAIFASQYFSFVDCFQKPPKRRAVAETPQANSSSSSSSASSWSSSSTSSSSSSPIVEHHHRRLEVQYDPGCSSPTKSPIRPRILPMWPDTPVPDETIHLKPPMSPIQITGFVATTNMGDFEGNNKHRHTTTTSSSSYNNYFSPISLKRKFHSTLL